jgi:microcystin-dependent protein
MLVGFNYAPAGWAQANGALMNVRQFGALFGLIGTTYGGDGGSTFALPNLQGAVAIGAGSVPGSPIVYVPGQRGGTPTVTLTTGQLPSHTHNLQVSHIEGSLAPPGGNSPGNAKLAAGSLYVNAAPTTPMSSTAVSTFAGGGQSHDNMMPYLYMNWVIALQRVYPEHP